MSTPTDRDSRWFEDFRIGEVYEIPSRTQTDALFAMFAAATGDNHPIHYDRHYCQARGHRDMLAHGLQVLGQTAAGAGRFPHELGDALIGFLEVSARFLRPVYVGDTLYPRLEVIGLEPGRSTGVIAMRATAHNQDGDLVLEGIHRYLVRKRPAATA